MNDDLKPPHCDGSMNNVNGAYHIAMLIILRLRDKLHADKDAALTPSDAADVIVDCVTLALNKAIENIEEVANAWKEEGCI